MHTLLQCAVVPRVALHTRTHAFSPHEGVTRAAPHTRTHAISPHDGSVNIAQQQQQFQQCQQHAQLSGTDSGAGPGGKRRMGLGPTGPMGMGMAERGGPMGGMGGPMGGMGGPMGGIGGAIGQMGGPMGGMGGPTRMMGQMGQMVTGGQMGMRLPMPMEGMSPGGVPPSGGGAPLPPLDVSPPMPEDAQDTKRQNMLEVEFA
eukprot:gene24243-9840_t